MKAYEIPVSRPVLKMLRRDHGYSRHLVIDRWVFAKAVGHPGMWERYITETKPNQVRITLVSRYASKGKLYTVARLMEFEFDCKMMTYIQGATEAGMPAAEAIRCFFEKYDVSEDDMKLETAYKRWQRFQNKEYQRELIPLW
jgi:hypothetical protein